MKFAWGARSPEVKLADEKIVWKPDVSVSPYAGNTLVQLSGFDGEEFEYVSWKRRLAAFFLDEIIVLLFLFLPIASIVVSIISVGCLVGEQLFFQFALPVLISLMLLSLAYPLLRCWLYPVLFERSSLQATPGKLALGLIVCDSKGDKMSFLSASVRIIVQSFLTLLFSVIAIYLFTLIPGSSKAVNLISEFIVFVCLAFGYSCCFFNQRRQTFFDLVCRRVVLQKKTPGAPEFASGILSCLSNLMSPLPKRLIICVSFLMIMAVCAASTVGYKASLAMTHLQKAQDAMLNGREKERFSQSLEAEKCLPGVKLLLTYLSNFSPNASDRLWLQRSSAAINFTPSGFRELIESELKYGSADEARKYFSILFRVTSVDDEAQRLVLAARIAFKSKEQAQALQLVNRAIALEPRYYDAYRGRAQLHSLAGDAKAAQADEKLAEKCFYEFSKDVVNDFSLYVSEDDGKLKLAEANTLIGKYPHFVKAYLLKANALSVLERDKEALSTFNKVVSMAPWSALALYSRSEHFSSKEQYKNALADINHALGLLPENGDLLLERARIYSNLHQWNKALQDSTKVISSGFYISYVPLLDRAMIYKDMGKFDDALADAKQALTLAPSDSAREQCQMWIKITEDAKMEGVKPE